MHPSVSGNMESYAVERTESPTHDRCFVLFAGLHALCTCTLDDELIGEL